ncbi:MAG: amidase family protein, partial [Pseudomonadales bacterium]
MNNIEYQSASELVRLIKSGAVSSVALTEHYIDRIEQFDGDINAVVVRTFDAARRAAKQADDALAEGRDLGPLHG